MKIGVLALQGAFIEHIGALTGLGCECAELRQAADLEGIDALVLPGGESTVQGKLLRQLGMLEPIKAMIKDGLPVLATCAGLILLAGKIEGGEAPHLATLPVTVARNAFGRQLASFHIRGKLGEWTDVPMTFIRAPYITKAAPAVEVLATVRNHIVAVKYKNQLAMAFHPELDEDVRLHRWLVQLAEARKA